MKPRHILSFFTRWLHIWLCLAACGACLGTTQAELDLDGNGLSDVWEAIYFGQVGASGVTASGDPDGDGQNNAAESQMGTDPLSASSIGRLLDFQHRVDNGVTNSIASIFPSNQTVEATWLGSSNLISSSFTPFVVDAPLPSNGALDAQHGSVGFIHFKLSARDQDGDGLSDWEEVQSGLDPTLPQTFPPTPDYQWLSNQFNSASVFSISASPISVTDTNQASVTIQRSGSIFPETVNLSYGAPLLNGVDFDYLPTSIVFPFGVMQTTLIFRVTGAGLPPASASTLVTILSDPDYGIGIASTQIDVTYTLPSVFVADLLPTNTVNLANGSSTAWTPAHGKMRMFVSGDRQQIELYIDLAGLAPNLSPITGIELYFGSPLASSSSLIHSIPPLSGGVAPSGSIAIPLSAISLTDLVNGSLHGLIRSSAFPSGHLIAPFVIADGSPSTVVSASASWTPSASLTQAEAARFLIQASFGADMASIAQVQALGIEGWIDQQLALPASLHTPLYDARPAPRDSAQRIGVWWDHSVNAPDQLRQRIAFALSEIFVASEDDPTLTTKHRTLSLYYDLLVSGAFGTYRDLLEEVTLSPAMGIYLSMLGNRKAKPGSSQRPDENYAREVMQLFSIGLWELHPDGRQITGPLGEPIPTYDQSTIEETARVLTGWGWNKATPADSIIFAPRDYESRMDLYELEHDAGMKRIIRNEIVPAGQGGQADFDQLLDALLFHPNTAPFICRQLIQRLVTSNPSPAYTHRVSSVFIDNGSGQRGDLGAVVKAILLDPEARDPALQSHPLFGRLQEPIVRLTQLLRGVGNDLGGGSFTIPDTAFYVGQAPLDSKSVFNFFRPDYAASGDIRNARVDSPEFEISSGSQLILQANTMRQILYDGIPVENRLIRIDTSSLQPLAVNPVALVDRLNLLLSGGRASANLRSIVEASVAASPAGLSAQRANTAVQLFSIAPEVLIAK